MLATMTPTHNGSRRWRCTFKKRGREGLYDNSWGSGLLVEAWGGVLRTRVWRATAFLCPLWGVRRDSGARDRRVPQHIPPARTMSLPTALGFRIGSSIEREVIEVTKRRLEFWWQNCALGQRLWEGLQGRCSVERRKEWPFYCFFFLCFCFLLCFFFFKAWLHVWAAIARFKGHSHHHHQQLRLFAYWHTRIKKLFKTWSKLKRWRVTYSWHFCMHRFTHEPVHIMCFNFISVEGSAGLCRKP